LNANRFLYVADPLGLRESLGQTATVLLAFSGFRNRLVNIRCEVINRSSIFFSKRPTRGIEFSLWKHNNIFKSRRIKKGEGTPPTASVIEEELYYRPGPNDSFKDA
jgi:hypothetical protein